MQVQQAPVHPAPPEPLQPPKLQQCLSAAGCELKGVLLCCLLPAGKVPFKHCSMCCPGAGWPVVSLAWITRYVSLGLARSC